MWSTLQCTMLWGDLEHRQPQDSLEEMYNSQLQAVVGIGKAHSISVVTLIKTSI